MKKIKFLFVAVAILIVSAISNDARASDSVDMGIKKTENNGSGKFVFEKKPLIQIIYFYTTCPDGTVQCVGNVGLTDGGQYIGHYYWGDAVACEGHQPSPWVW
ncbi:MAG TPA: hypothetical protein VGO58_06380 [Chitinophagaceae bacterium]|nr:hypothetical protein [Chitinophagaceae bacterium]